MIPKPLDQVTTADLELLVQNAVREDKQMEFKSVLPGGGDEDKKEFLADVSSFANASGGDLVYGIEEKEGEAKCICGLSDRDLDAEVLRLENMLRDGLAPRIFGIHMRVIPGLTQGPVLIMRIQRSWAGPHMVTFKGSSRFFTRDNGGKHMMDVGEIRISFGASASLSESIRSFRAERLGRLLGQEAPFMMRDRPTIVLHMVPLGAFHAGTNIDLSILNGGAIQLPPLRSQRWSSRYNFDGFITFSQDVESGEVRSYLQVFRTGALEAVTSRLALEEEKRIPSEVFEKTIIESLGKYAKALESISVEPPLVIMMSLLRTKGLSMITSGLYDAPGPQGIEKDTLVLPEVVWEAPSSVSPSLLMRPVFDAIWQAAGWPRSINYDGKGKWVGQRR
ncbi:MAG: helix-turn-helix domain-containing protein [Candidatus Brocadiia bacterium]